MRPPNNNPNQPHQPPAPQPVPPTPRRRKRFRWGLFVGFPVLLAVLAWIFNNLESAFDWDDLLSQLHVVHKMRFTKLMALGVVICCICVIARVIRRQEDDEP